MTLRYTRARAAFGRAGRDARSLVGDTYDEWSADGAPRMAAALACDTTLSLAPRLRVIIAVAGIAFGADAVRGELVAQIGRGTGGDSALAIEDLLANARRPARGLIASAIGIVMLLLGASGVVAEFESALNTIWKMAPATDSWRRLFVNRVAWLAMLLAIGLLRLVSLVLSTAVAAAGRYAGSFLPGSEAVCMLAEMIASFAVVTALFATLFTFLPNAPVRWSDVWLGAAITAVLFNLGKLLIGLYLGRSSIGSACGAAGSLVVVLVWIYYAAQILFFGAELTHVHAVRRQTARRLANA